MYSTNLAQVVDIVVSHQGVEIKTQLIGQLMSALVLPAPEHYRPLLRRLAALSEMPWLPVLVHDECCRTRHTAHICCLLLHVMQHQFCWYGSGNEGLYSGISLSCQIKTASWSCLPCVSHCSRMWCAPAST